MCDVSNSVESGLCYMQAYNPFKKNLEKIDGLLICKTWGTKIYCCLNIKIEPIKNYTPRKYFNALNRSLDKLKKVIEIPNTEFGVQPFLNQMKGCYLSVYLENNCYIEMTIQFIGD